MNPVLAQREVALAGVALVAVVAALALTGGGSRGAAQDALPRPVPSPSGEWYAALAAPRGSAGYGKRTACGTLLRRDTLGVAHPVLPCGAKLYLRFGEKRVLTQVIDRGPNVPGRDFDMTEALAAELDLHGVQPIRWTFAGRTP